MSDILYIKIDENVSVTYPRVYLQDIAELSCSDKKILNRLRILPVADFRQLPGNQYVVSIIDLIKQIEYTMPQLQVECLGETDFIITYRPEKKYLLLQWIKVVFICFTAFFGSAFSIMTFNCDADVGTLFKQIYTQVTGNPSNGFTILEITYSIGIGLGVLFFFNHFGRFRFSSEPTPLQVQMCLYEKNVDSAIVKESQRSKKGT